MYRSWLALGVAGLLAGVAVVSLFVGFGSPAFFALAAVSGVGAYLAYRYAADRMVRSVYAGVGRAGVTDGGEQWSDGTDGETVSGGGTSEAVDGATAARAPGSGDYDEWTWADVEPDDPFWSEDTDDWEDPWETNTTDPSAASNGDWRRRRGSESRSQNRNRSASDDGPPAGEPDARDRLREAYETLGLEPGAGPEAVRSAYRERVKEAHPDTPDGSAEEFIRVREAYELLRERLGGRASAPGTGSDSGSE